MTFRLDTAWPSELEPDRTAVEEERLAGKSEAAMLSPLPVYVELGADRDRITHTVNLAQRHDDSPIWETSVLPEKFRDGRLPGDFKLRVGPGEPEGLVHLVQHYRLAPGERIQFVCAAGLSPEAARASFEEARSVRAAEESERAWRRYFAGLPQFSSSDPWLTAAYWYRWYGLRLNTVDMPDLPIRATSFQPVSGSAFQAEDGELGFSPFVAEGIGFFRNFVTYSAQAHLREVAWMHDPQLASGILENLGKCQRPDGSFPGHNYSCRPSRDFYHADFATGVRIVGALHGLEATFEAKRAMRRYLDYLRNERLSDGSEGILIFDQNETGQEYMSRYQRASANADSWGEFRIVGAEATYYAYLLARLVLEWVTQTEPEPVVDLYEWLVVSLRNALTTCFKDDFFCDRIGDHISEARPAVGLYPAAYGEHFVQDRHRLLELAHRWLLDPNQFWLPKGFPATAASDPTFSAEGEWKEKRLNCPWNGRSWPMANSHLVDAVANVARNAKSPDLRIKAGEALMKAIKLMFHDGDPNRPNSYEHYNPVTGTPASYRGYDDYMHSWIVDLVMRHAAGVQPGQDTIDPLPLDVDWIECRDIPHPRGRMHVRIERGKEPAVEIVACVK